MIKSRLQAFFKDTSGAITVDWIVLTAAVVALAATTIGVIQTGSENLSDNAGTFMETHPFF